MFKPVSIMFYCNSISGICFMHFCQHFQNEHFSPHPPTLHKHSFLAKIQYMACFLELYVQNLNIYAQPPQ
ncbi:hypothetical protein DPMN_080219 [Dreissena polymorpha]|uniref:Uncharacterized protein n=1 Tax=Dreissena polymorpha TaxID=45954 RepID=A0A9D4BQS3_DREPO|nr:hypothetical protein DPMN_080219 [Dreissena polymorpha]